MDAALGPAPTGERTVALYRACAKHYGRSTCTKSALNAEGEQAWAALLARPGFRPWTKLMWRGDSFHPAEGYASGDAAVVERGIDLRFGWDPSGERLLGVVGFGRGAGWAPEFPDEQGRMGVHGGVFHTVLDEVTAEVAKYHKTPAILTSSATIKLLASLHVGEHCALEARITKTQGARIFVEAKLTRGTVVHATGEFVLADMTALQRAM